MKEVDAQIFAELSENNFLSDICSIIDAGRKKAYSEVSSVIIETNWNIGKRIVEQEQHGKARADYGKRLISGLSKELTARYGQGFGVRTISYCRKLYVMFENWPILHTRVQNLTWSHLRSLLSVENEDARFWYMNEASNEGWSVRTLERNIASQYYFRLLQSPQKEKVVSEMKALTADLQADKNEFLKNPVVAEFLGLSPNSDFTESELEKAILTHLQKFLMEIGKGFAFVARQQHIHTDAGDYFIDLVFYNYILKYFVLIDLKTTQISHADVGQMDMYVRMYDELKRTDGDNPTLGIILCSQTSKDIARYSVLHDSKQLYMAKYLTYLPSEEELKKEIEAEKEVFELQHKQM